MAKRHAASVLLCLLFSHLVDPQWKHMQHDSHSGVREPPHHRMGAPLWSGHLFDTTVVSVLHLFHSGIPDDILATICMNTQLLHYGSPAAWMPFKT